MQHIIQTMYHFDKPGVYLRSHIDQAASIFLIGLIFITLIMAMRSTILSYAAISVLLAVNMQHGV